MLSSFNKVVAQTNCEGTPNPGNTISSVSSVCPTQNFTLSLENATAGAGVTYQWESADDVDFTVNPENLGTNSTQTANISSSKYFRCLVTCTNSSESAYSTPVLVTATSFLECYCIPPVPSNGCDGDNVVSVVLGTLNDVGQTCTPVYQDRSALQNAIPTLTQGQNIEMSVGVGDGGTESVGVWIDFDQNGVFDADEFFALGSGNDEVITNTITIPIDALAGNTKMRVRVQYSSAFTGGDACSQVSYGSTRDYLVNLTDPPTCFSPISIEVSDITLTSATITWTASISAPTNGYQIYYNTTGEAPNSSATPIDVSAGTTSFPTGDVLTHSTTYYVWLRSNCGGDDYSTWAGPISFSTMMCMPSPWLESFETSTLPDGWTTDAMSLSNNSSAINSGDGSTTYYMYKNLYSTTYSTGNFSTVLIGPITGTEDFSFDYKIANYYSPYAPPASGTGNFVLEISTDFGNTWSEIETVSNNGVAGWQTKAYDLSTYVNTGDFLKFRITANWISGDYCIGFDNFNLASCLPVSDLSASNITNASATISWTASGSNPDDYQVYVSLANIAPAEDETNIEISNTNSIDLTGLEDSPLHYVWVRSDCGAGDISEWVGPLALWTSCEPIVALPYTENFDAYGTGTTAFPNCWSKPETYNSYPYIVDAYSVSSPASLRFNSSTTTPTYAVSPAFAEDIQNLRVSFQLRAESTTYSGTIELGVMSDPNDISTFESVATIQPTNTSFNYYYYDLYLATLSGANNYIALRHNATSTSYYYWLDDFKVELSPSCLEPANFEASNINTTSVSLSWTALPTAPENGYDIYVSETETAPTELSAPTHNTAEALINIEGLTSATVYYAWLRANCNNSDVGEWTGPITFTTLCPPIATLSYTENFDSYSVGNFPDCWLRPVTYNGFPSIVSGSSYSVSSPNGLKFQSLTTTPTYAISPAFAEDIHNLRVSFQLKAESTTYSGTIELGVMSDPNDLSTFESVAIIQPENTSFNAYQYDLYSTTLSGANNHIALRHNSNSSSWYYWLDNFEVDLSPTCIEPNGFAVNSVTANSASISWTESITLPENGYDIYFSTTATAPTGSSTPTHNTNETSFLFENLDESTNYYVWIRANCNDADQSDWTGPLHIYTGYCIPTNTSTSYWISSLTTTGGITNISHTGITSQPGGYGDFSAIHSCSNVEGQPTMINFAQNTSTGYYFCWIDWNKDMQFDATERIIAATSSYSSTYQGTINIPAGTEPGEYRMRVANSYLYEITDACTGSGYGQYFDYTFVVVEPANNETDILTYSFEEQIAPATIDNVEHKVYVTVAAGTNLNGLVATFTLSEGATATVTGLPQQSGVTPNNFTYPVVYKVVAENGLDEQLWQVIVDVEDTGLSSEADILAYTIPNQVGLTSINSTNRTVALTVPYGTDLTALVATFTLSNGATAEVETVAQQSGVTPNNFTNPVTYTVTAENGTTTKNWTVTVTEAPASDQADILSYVIPNQVGLTSINSTNKTVALTVPYGTDVTALVATFTLSNGATAEVETVTQQSGVTPNNFTNPVTYTVTAEDGTTTKDWIVTVTVAGEPLSSEADILTFSFAEQFEEAIINNVNRTVNIKVNEGTNLTNLVATFTLSEGAIAKVAGLVQQSGVTPNNFTNIVIYSVTAEDGTTVKNWAVNVSEHSGIEDIEISKLSIYPNPNNGRFTLDFSDIYGKVNYQIYDTKGSIILSDNLVVNGNAMKEVSLNIAPGVYYVKLITETQSIIEKLVVE